MNIVTKLKRNKNNKSCHAPRDNNKKNKDNSNQDHGYGETNNYWKLIIATIPLVFAIWVTVGHFVGIEIIPNFMINPWFLFSIATFTLVLFSTNYLIPVFKSIKSFKLSISLFLAISLLTAYFYSLYVMGNYYYDFDLYFENQLFAETIEIAVIVYIGGWIESYVTSKTRKNIDSILTLYEKKALIIKNGKTIEIDTKDLKIGDIVIVQNGAKFPVDGIIIKGNTIVDESIFTGESIPVNKTKGSEVFGGSISQGELIHYKVTKTQEDSMISQIIESIQSIRLEKTKPAQIADRVSKYVLPFILISGLLTLILTGALVSWESGVTTFITTIIVACPMSYVLLSPTSSLISTSIATKKGIVFHSPDIFQKITNIDAIAFDKTGTLTQGKISVIKTTIPEKYWSVISSMESISTHPIAKSVVSYFNVKNIKNINAKEHTGLGIVGNYNDKTYYFGSLSFISKYCKSYKDEDWILESKKRGSTFSYLVENNKFIGVIELRDGIKLSAKPVIKKLRNKNIQIYLLTGDNEYSAKYIGEQLDIKQENIFFDLKPQDKEEYISTWQKEGKKVVFVGDGINDIIALEKSDIGIAISSGSDLAVDNSDISIQKNDLNLVLDSLKISKATLNTIWFGIIVATIYILTIVPVAAFGLLIPFFGAVFMVFNDLLPLLVSLTLLRLKRNIK